MIDCMDGFPPEFGEQERQTGEGGEMGENKYNPDVENEDEVV